MTFIESNVWGGSVICSSQTKSRNAKVILPVNSSFDAKCHSKTDSLRYEPGLIRHLSALKIFSALSPSNALQNVYYVNETIRPLSPPNELQNVVCKRNDSAPLFPFEFGW